jgi:probable F420-dependent oxidoreductase
VEGLKVGLLAPHTGAAAGPESLRQVAVAAEGLGFDSMWCGDHVMLPANQESQYPYGSQDADDSYEVPADRPFLEPMSSLGFLAAVTTRLTLGVSVAILPYRSPALWAKTIGTVNLLARGRFVLGAGVGWLAEEFEVLGSDFSTRGRRVDETLRFLQTAWEATGPVSFEGEFIEVKDMYLNPAKGADVPPPVWVGGNGAPALRRTAAFGDAWHPHIRGTTPKVLAEGLGRIVELADGRSPDGGFTGAIHCPLEIADQVAGHPWEIGRMEGPLDYLAETLEEYRQAGLAHIIFTFGGSARRRIGILEQLAEGLSLHPARAEA